MFDALPHRRRRLRLIGLAVGLVLVWTPVAIAAMVGSSPFGDLVDRTDAAPVTPQSPESPLPPAGTGGPQTGSPTTPSEPAVDDVRYQRPLYVDPQTSASRSGGFARLADQPQAFFVGDEFADPATARYVVADYARRAKRARATPVVATYALPDLGCSPNIAGALGSAAAYRVWISAVAEGLEGLHAIVLLEPDSVAFMSDPACADPGPRQALLTFATEKLQDAGSWVYLDAGNSGWRNPVEMADNLRKSGVALARGFATNTGNYRPTADELLWARAITESLRQGGDRDVHFVIETARNGARPEVPVSEFCNPPSARIGSPPRMVFTGSLDGYLWVKHPGESDGTCNGGPPAGAWWPAGARRLLGGA